MKSPITYYGGKAKLAKLIHRLAPQHKKYCEPFAGGLSYFFHKAPCHFEVISDTNGMVTNFYRALKSPKRFKKLVELCEGTLHAENEWEKSRFIYVHPCGFTKVERAWAFWALFNMSFGGMGAEGSYQITIHTHDNWIPPVRLKNKREALKHYGTRLERTLILDKCATEVIKKFNLADMFFYFDPPYAGAAQGHYKGYTFEAFERLLQACSKIKGKFLLSSYDSDVLQHYVEQYGWQQYRKEQALLVSAKGDRKVEVFTANYPLQVQEKKQQKLQLAL